MWLDSQVVRFVPIALGVPRAAVVAVLQAFYDGSGKDSSVLTLAGTAADAGIWPAFERVWGQIVNDLNAGKPIHAADLMRNGNSAGARVVNACVDLLASLDADAYPMRCCSVNMTDFVRVQHARPALGRKKPAALCVDVCVGDLFNHLDIDWDEPGTSPLIEIVFDRDEPFLHTIYRVFTAPAKHRPDWARAVRDFPQRPRINSIRAGDTADFLELQAADVLAWVANRHHVTGDHEDWWGKLWGARGTDFVLCDYTWFMDNIVP